ncbi:hypothetical protein GGF31_006714 [Allomyces arbusculus]|nr:hypothetical protein GGF31_006714 [Allomyces arbusculus]
MSKSPTAANAGTGGAFTAIPVLPGAVSSPAVASNPPRPGPTHALDLDDQLSAGIDDYDDPWADMLGDWHPPTSRRRPYLSLRPRPVPTLILFVCTILYLTVATHNDEIHVSASFQTIVNLGMALALVLVKQLWIPNPKDDVLAAPASLVARGMRFAVPAAAWYLYLVTTLATLHRAGAQLFVMVQSSLPVLVVLLVKRFSTRAVSSTVHLSPRLMACLVAVMMGIALFSAAVDDPVAPDADMWVMILAATATATLAGTILWMEKYFLEVETDPWVLATNIAMVGLPISAVGWVLFDRSLPTSSTTSHAWIAPTVRTGILSAASLVASAFLVQHISSLALALLTMICHIVFIVFDWQLRGLDLTWYGVVGVVLVAAGMRFLGRASPSDGVGADASASGSNGGAGGMYAAAPTSQGPDDL